MSGEIKLRQAERSLAQRMAAALVDMPADRRSYYLRELSDPEVALDLQYCWGVWGRPKQLRPEVTDHSIVLWLNGRGFGKTRALVEIMTEEVMRGDVTLACLVGREQTELEQYTIGHNNNEGKGFINCAPPWFRPVYRVKDEVLEWPSIGNKKSAYFHTHSGKVKEFRGGSYQRIWGDEFAFWQYRDSLMNHLMLTLREVTTDGTQPLLYLTTTPTKCKILRDLVRNPRCKLIQGSTFENAANLARNYINEQMLRVQTRQGREELLAELLEDVEGALFHEAHIEALRLDTPPRLVRTIVAVDPATTSHQRSDETGIVVGGEGSDGRFYILEDMSGRHKPHEWAALVVRAFDKWHADVVVAEVNRGGDLVVSNLQSTRDANDKRRVIPVKVIKASKGKALRAEPVAALYEQGLVHHVGNFPEMETEMTEWDGHGDSPNRLDAAVYAVWELAHISPDKEDPDVASPEGFRGLGKLNRPSKSEDRDRRDDRPL